MEDSFALCGLLMHDRLESTADANAGSIYMFFFFFPFLTKLPVSRTRKGMYARFWFGYPFLALRPNLKIFPDV